MVYFYEIREAEITEMTYMELMKDLTRQKENVIQLSG